jgi:hypothetical protein
MFKLLGSFSGFPVLGRENNRLSDLPAYVCGRKACPLASLFRSHAPFAESP